jgi:hypothetical protein
VPLAERFRAAHRGTGTRIWENERALPFAWWVPGFVHVPDDQTLDLLTSPRFDPRVTALVPEEVNGLSATGAPSTPEGSRVSVVRRTFNTVALDVTAPAAGLVVVNQTAAPGWRARVDGQPAPLYTANAIQLAVLVPQGARRVELEYVPGSVQAGLAISGVTAIALVGWAALSRRRRRPAGASGVSVPGAAAGDHGPAPSADGDTAAGSAPAPPHRDGQTPAAPAPARQTAAR